MTLEDVGEMSATHLLIPNVRLNWVKLDKPEPVKSNPEGKKYFSCELILNKKTHAKQMSARFECIAAAAEERWGTKWKRTLKRAQEAGKVNLGYDEDHFERDAEDGSTYTPEWYEGCHVLRPSNTSRPTVVDRLGEPVVPGDPGFPYSGCFANVIIKYWAWDKPLPAINIELSGVMFQADGDVIGGGGSRSVRRDAFADLIRKNESAAGSEADDEDAENVLADLGF
jgi:hypothetical protein